MPSYRLLVAALICLRFAAGSFAEDTTVTANGFSLRMPADWEQVDAEKALITARSPRLSDEDAFRENVQLFVYPVGKSFTAKQVLQRQKSDTGRYRLIDEGEVSGATVPMMWMAITPKVPRGPSDRLVKIDFITTRGDTIVVLTAMDEIEKWKDHLDIFRVIAKSLQHPK